MSDSLVQGLNNGRPVPQNHSIGKNGSFWLPKKIAEQGTNHKQRVNQSKSQKTPTESQTSKNSSKLLKAFQKASPSLLKALQSSPKISQSVGKASQCIAYYILMYNVCTILTYVCIRCHSKLEFSFCCRFETSHIAMHM